MGTARVSQIPQAQIAVISGGNRRGGGRIVHTVDYTHRDDLEKMRQQAQEWADRSGGVIRLAIITETSDILATPQQWEL